ncbi:MAG: ABC transporter permease [Alphaproteobacteria bacterium]|nr:ABC transporter permease [Alphaproteobacteria bacterium]
MQLVTELKTYCYMLYKMVQKPENSKMFFKEFISNCYEIGFGAFPIVAIVSFFLGAVTTVQTAYQLVSPFIPISTLGEIVRDSIILELSPTMVSLMLAGIIGSKMASELGNMQLTEQIDALEIMGINSYNFLIFPKVLATLVVMPLLIIISMFIGIWSGRFIGYTSGVINAVNFDEGIRDGFKIYNVIFALIKAYTYSIIISTISSFYGYHTKGGALEIGRSGTKAVVVSSILILFADFILAKILL